MSFRFSGNSADTEYAYGVWQTIVDSGDGCNTRYIITDEQSGTSIDNYFVTKRAVCAMTSPDAERIAVNYNRRSIPITIRVQDEPYYIPTGYDKDSGSYHFDILTGLDQIMSYMDSSAELRYRGDNWDARTGYDTIGRKEGQSYPLLRAEVKNVQYSWTSGETAVTFEYWTNLGDNTGGTVELAAFDFGANNPSGPYYTISQRYVVENGVIRRDGSLWTTVQPDWPG